jgi:hypothetical protein
MTQRLIFLLSVILAAHGPCAIGQEFRVPEGYKFESQADFTHYEPDILRCVDFLETAPINKDADNRKKANAFFLRWLTGTARVTIKVQGYVMELAEENKDLLMVYLGGWARFVLQNPDNKAEMDCHIAGIQSVLKAYQHCAGIEQDDNLDDLLALEKEGKLRAWVLEHMESK